jgi:hypothetical protein
MSPTCTTSTMITGLDGQRSPRPEPKLLWQPEKGKKTQMDEFHALVNGRYDLSLSKACHLSFILLMYEFRIL